MRRAGTRISSQLRLGVSTTSGLLDDLQVWGAALCSTTAVTNPVYVSIGHLMSLDTSIAIAQACSQYRVPEPIRQADLRSRAVIRDWNSSNTVNTTLNLYRVNSTHGL